MDKCKLKNSKSELVVQRFGSMKKIDLLETRLTPEFAKNISIFWNDPGIQCTYEISTKQAIMDNTPYFFNQMDEIVKESYNPTFEDYVCFVVFFVVIVSLLIL